MTPQEELNQIRSQIASLEEEKQALEALRLAKIRKIQLQLSNIPTRFAKEHPVIATFAKGIVQGGQYAGKETNRALRSEEVRSTVEQLKKLGKYIYENRKAKLNKPGKLYA